MRITAVSDLHGKLDNVSRALDESSPDLLLSCGDWGDEGEINPADVRKIIEKVEVYTVYGNHDDMELFSELTNSDGSPVLLRTGQVQEFSGLRIAGINGIWAKSHKKPYYITDAEVAEIASSLAEVKIDILLSHGCPIGIADRPPGGGRGGQRMFLDAFHVISPRLYLCGHLHVPQERTLKDGRIVVNVGYTCEGDYWTFDVETDRIKYEQHRV